MDHYFTNNRKASMTTEVINGTLSSRFEHVETSLLSEPVVSGRYGTHRQVFEKRQSQGEAEGRCSTARLERDCQHHGSRSAPCYEGSR